MARCMQERDTTAALSRDLTLADQLGINGVTPTFLIQGFPLQGILPFPVLDALIRKLLHEKMD
jgi:protein-disulfide isomerase